jgi:hypothetical protein
MELRINSAQPGGVEFTNYLTPYAGPQHVFWRYSAALLQAFSKPLAWQS